MTLGLAQEGHGQERLTHLRHGQEQSSQVKSPGGFRASAGCVQSLVHLEPEGEDGSQLQVDNRDDAEGAGLIGNVAGRIQAIEAPGGHDVDGGQLVHGPDAPNGEAVFVGKVAGSLEHGLGLGQIG